MRLSIIDNVDGLTMAQTQQLTQQLIALNIDLVFLKKVNQHSNRKQAMLTINQFVLNDGISKVYQDNPALHLHTQAENFVSAVFWTQQIYTDHHCGQALMCQQVVTRVWFRQLRPLVKLIVVDFPKVVYAFVSEGLPNLFGRMELLCVADLLKAQVKPVVLIVPQSTELASLDNQMFETLHYQLVESIILTGVMLLTDFGVKQIVQQKWPENWPIILVELT